MRECVRALEQIGYEGAISIEHEPETFDPTDDLRGMRARAGGVARVRVALVGADIAQSYAARIAEEPRLEVAGATDVVPGRAAALVAQHGGTDFESLQAVLADGTVDVVVNLTPPSAHAAVTTAALDEGKHVHTEKPLALTGDEARKLAGSRTSAAFA